MRHCVKRLLILTFVLTAAGWHQHITLSASEELPVVFVVRHAERADAGAPGGAGMMASDPPLSAAGTARAKALAAMLRDAGVARVFATEFRRTRETAAPIASAQRLNVVTVPAKDVAGLAERLNEPGGPALVVGHSNTVPDILKALGVSQPVTLAENDYDNLFIVLRGAGEAQLLRLKY